MEKMFKTFKQQCRIAKRHGKTIITFESFVNLATAAYRHSSLWPKHLANTNQPASPQRSFKKSSYRALALVDF